MTSRLIASERRTYGDYVFFYACCLASLAGVAGQPVSGASTADSEAEVRLATALLSKAAGTGYRQPDTYRTETALDPIRDRPEFRVLLLDLAFPARPFVPTS